MDKHKVLLGAFYIVFGAFTVVGSLMIMIYIALHGGIIQHATSLYEVLKLIIFFGSAFLLLVSFTGIIGGIGLINQKSWARNLILVVSFFYLFFIPLGTFLSMYTMLVLMRDQIALLFTSPTTVYQNEVYGFEYSR